METTQVKELIHKWRSLNTDLKAKNKELDEARESLREFESDHTRSKQEWELEKEKLRQTINAVLADVTSKKAELQAIERETAELRAKVDERRRRNKEHETVLTKRRKTIADQIKTAEEKEAAVKERFRLFESTREESRQQLLSSIKKLEDSVPAEREAHDQKVMRLKQRIEETTAAMEAEAKSWALEQAMREWSERSEARKCLVEELGAAENGKDAWAELIQDANTMQVADCFTALNELRSILSA